MQRLVCSCAPVCVRFVAGGDNINSIHAQLNQSHIDFPTNSTQSHVERAQTLNPITDAIGYYALSISESLI